SPEQEDVKFGRPAARTAHGPVATCLSGEDVVHELLLPIDEFVGAQGVDAIGLAELAQDQALAVTLQIDTRSRIRLELQHLTDAKVRDFAQPHLKLVEHGPQSDVRLRDLALYLLRPARV